MLAGTPARHLKPNQQVRLSEVIARPGIYTNSKRLNIPNQSIAIIDPVSDKYRKIEQLNLRGNCIAQLGEICQFTGLRMLDLTNNKIADQRELLLMANFRNLQVLHVGGNPFLQSRLTTEVLAVLEQLGCELSIQPTIAGGKPEEEERLENDLLENYTELIFIQSLYRKTEMHIELVQEHNMDECDDPDYKYLLRNKDAILELDQSTCQRFLQELRLDAYALKKTLNLPDLLIAYRNLIDKQNDKRQQLISLVDKRAKHLSDSLQRKRKALSALKRDESNVTFSPKKSKQGLQQQSPGKTTKKTENTGTNEPTARKKLREPLSEENLQAIYYKNLTKRNPVYHLLYSPLHSLKPKEKDLLIETLSAHLKERTIELYRKEELLRNNEQTYRQKCEDLNEQINILTEQKCQLTRRLIEFETTMKDFHFDVKGKLRLEKEVDRRQTQLVEAQANSELYKEMYERVREGVEYMADTDKKEEELASQSDKRRVAGYFKLLCHKWEKLRNLRNLRKINKEREGKRLLSSTFDALRRNSLIERIIKLKAAESNAVRMETSFVAMVAYSKRKRQEKRLQKVLSLGLKKEAMLLMRQNIAFLAINRARLNRANMHSKFTALSKCWKAMKSEWIRWGPAAMKPISVRVAQRYSRKLAAKALMGWLGLHDECKKERILTQNRVEEWRLRRYLAHPFQRWCQQNRLQQSLMEEKERQLVMLQRAASLQSIAKEFIEKGKTNAKKAKLARSKLQSLCWLVRKESINHKLQLKLKQFYLGCRRNRQECLRLFLRLKERTKKYLGHKAFKLTSTLMTGRAKTFFSFYPSIKQARTKMNNNIANMQNLHFLRLLSKTFEGWRYTTLRDRLQEHRKQLQPVLEDMKHKQLHFNRMSSILRNELEAKDEKLRLYDKKIENMVAQKNAQEGRLEKMRLNYESSLGEMRLRECEFMEIIEKLQNKFDMVSAEVDHLTIEQIKKTYKSRYVEASATSSVETSKIELRNRLSAAYQGSNF